MAKESRAELRKKLRKLQKIRLGLIVLAVVLALGSLGVGLIWLPREQVQQAEPETTATTESQRVIIPPTRGDEEQEGKEGEDPETPSTSAPQPNYNWGGEEPEYYAPPSQDGGEIPVNPVPTPTPTPETPTPETPTPETPTPETPTPETPTPETPTPETPAPGSDSENVGKNNPEVVLPAPAPAAAGSADPVMDALAENATAMENTEKAEKQGSAASTVLWILLGLLAADIVAIVMISVKISKVAEEAKRVPAPVPVLPTISQKQIGGGSTITVGQIHNIGARPYQEDSFGVAELDDGILAVVADGMGGLSAGDKVSQKIVYTMLGYSDQIRPGCIDGVLERMVYGTNEAVNAMLGPKGLYKSGSTLLSVLVRQNRFHWITVGDSHIYYFHEGKLQQLNEEHNRGQELLRKAARGEITYEEARSDPKRNGLTSFIGMGQLKYVDKSQDSIPLVHGDRILLMTDGVFNAIPDRTMEAILNQCTDVKAVAAEMERLIVQKAHPKQDNFTAVILGF